MQKLRLVISVTVKEKIRKTLAALEGLRAVSGPSTTFILVESTFLFSTTVCLLINRYCTEFLYT